MQVDVATSDVLSRFGDPVRPLVALRIPRQAMKKSSDVICKKGVAYHDIDCTQSDIKTQRGIRDLHE